MRRFSVILLLLFGEFACKKAVVTKPAALLRLEDPEASYVYESLDGCTFRFDGTVYANVMYRDNCWTNIDYPSMNATIYMTYHPVKNNIDSLLRDVQKLTYVHSMKALSIIEQVSVDSD